MIEKENTFNHGIFIYLFNEKKKVLESGNFSIHHYLDLYCRANEIFTHKHYRTYNTTTGATVTFWGQTVLLSARERCRSVQTCVGIVLVSFFPFFFLN
jgi:hypothetical protein